jgi:flagellar biosynthetic protein FlhB
VWISYSIIHRELPEIAHIAQLGSARILARIAALWFELSWKCGLLLLAWSAADYGLQRWNYERSLRMTKQEVKAGGQGHRRQSARRAAAAAACGAPCLRKILAKEVARATAVVTNPTHYAVALEYRPETMSAPVVVAKGRNLLAAAHSRTRALARDSHHRNPPLAQALYKMTEVGQSIPPQAIHGGRRNPGLLVSRAAHACKARMPAGRS